MNSQNEKHELTEEQKQKLVQRIIKEETGKAVYTDARQAIEQIKKALKDKDNNSK